MNDWRNAMEWVNEWLKECNGLIEWMNDWRNVMDWVNEWLKECNELSEW